MLGDSGARVALTQGAARAVLESAAADQGPLRILDAQAQAADWAGCSAENLSPESIGLSSQHLAYIIYTSGSTGVPKGVGSFISGLTNRLTWAVESVLPEKPVTAMKTGIGFVDS